jgi:hypothetical protein
MSRIFGATMTASLGAMAILGFAVPAASAPSTSTTIIAAPVGMAPGKLICKTRAPDIGSRLGGERICMTHDDWMKKGRADHNALDDMALRTFGRETSTPSH